MTVKELIEQLQKLPPDDRIYADIITDQRMNAEILNVQRYGAASFIAVDRTKELEGLVEDSKETRRRWEEAQEEPEDEDVW